MDELEQRLRDEETKIRNLWRKSTQPYDRGYMDGIGMAIALLKDARGDQDEPENSEEAE